MGDLVWFQIDMAKIRKAYEETYNEILTDDIERKTSGIYRDLLVNIIGIQTQW